MALLSVNHVRIAGISAGVPKKVLKTISTSQRYNDQSFIHAVGIREKRYSEDFTTVDLCEVAARRLLQDLGWGNQLDLLLLVTQTPDFLLPASSCVLHGKLNLNQSCLALDINLGCSGWVYGLYTAMSMMSSGQIRRALVLSGDARKSFPEEHDQLFGYAGAATALEYVDEAPPITFDMGTDGAQYDAIIRWGGGARQPFHPGTLDLKLCEDGRMRHDCQTRMKGMDVFAFAISTAPSSIRKVAKAVGMDDLSTLDYLLLHQANQMILESIRKKLKLSPEQVPISLTNFGNTSSASIPLTLVANLADVLPQKAHRIMACAFGVGLSWGTMLATLDRHIVISPLQEL